MLSIEISYDILRILTQYWFIDVIIENLVTKILINILSDLILQTVAFLLTTGVKFLMINGSCFHSFIDYRCDHWTSIPTYSFIKSIVSLFTSRIFSKDKKLHFSIISRTLLQASNFLCRSYFLHYLLQICQLRVIISTMKLS